jgi:hypothetical protein
MTRESRRKLLDDAETVLVFDFIRVIIWGGIVVVGVALYIIWRTT